VEARYLNAKVAEAIAEEEWKKPKSGSHFKILVLKLYSVATVCLGLMLIFLIAFD